jgi:3D (Asp-Asp-Asp) domain-containing protein
MTGNRPRPWSRLPSAVLIALCCAWAASSGASLPQAAAATTASAAAWLPCAARPPCAPDAPPAATREPVSPVPLPQPGAPGGEDSPPRHLLRSPATGSAGPRGAPSGEEFLRVAGQLFRVLRRLTMIASAYGQGEPGVGLYTATGTRVHTGTLAVDPRVIRLGSTLFVRGYRSPYLPTGGLLGRAEDTGGEIRGSRIDIYLDGPLAAIRAFGLQTVQVLVLAPPS